MNITKSIKDVTLQDIAGMRRIAWSIEGKNVSVDILRISPFFLFSMRGSLLSEKPSCVCIDVEIFRSELHRKIKEKNIRKRVSDGTIISLIENKITEIRGKSSKFIGRLSFIDRIMNKPIYTFSVRINRFTQQLPKDKTPQTLGENLDI